MQLSLHIFMIFNLFIFILFSYSRFATLGDHDLAVLHTEIQRDWERQELRLRWVE